MSERRRSKRRKKKSSKKKMMIGVALLAVSLIVVAVAAFSLLRPQTDSFAQQDESVTAEYDDQSLEQFLDNASNEQLVNELRNLKDSSEMKLPIRFSQIEKRALIADSILAGQADAETKLLANRNKLDAMMLALTITLDQGADTGHLPAELGLYLESLKNQEDVELRRKAELARIMLDTEKLMDADFPVGESSYQSLLQKVKKLPAEDPNNFYAAQRLVLLGKLLEKRRETSKAGQAILAAIDSGYSASANTDVQTLLASLGQTALASTSNSFPQILNVKFSQQQASVDALLESMTGAIESQDLSAEKVPMLFERLHDLLTIGRTSEVREIKGLLESGSDSEIVKLATKRLSVLNAKLDMFDQAFDINGATEFSGQPAAFQMDAPKHRIIYAVKERNYGESVLKFDELLHSMRTEIAAENVEIAVIYLDGHKKSKAFEDLEKFAEKSAAFRIWYADGSTQAGNSLIKRIVPMRKVPHILVLSGENSHVQYIDPAIADIVRLF